MCEKITHRSKAKWDFNQILSSFIHYKTIHLQRTIVWFIFTGHIKNTLNKSNKENKLDFDRFWIWADVKLTLCCGKHLRYSMFYFRLNSRRELEQINNMERTSELNNSNFRCPFVFLFLIKTIKASTGWKNTIKHSDSNILPSVLYFTCKVTNLPEYKAVIGFTHHI